MGQVRSAPCHTLNHLVPVRSQYFLKVVATDVQPLGGEVLQTYQYSVTTHTEKLSEYEATLPGNLCGKTKLTPLGVFFKFDISPMLITMTQYRESFASFLIGLLAIVGGVATVAGIVDSLAYKAERAFSKKVQLGKAY